MLNARLSDSRILWAEEGVESSVADAERNGERRLLINGAIHGNTEGTWLQYHARIGHLAALAHPNPKEILIIGLGTGATAGTVALYPGTTVHVVELSGGVLSAGSVLAVENHELFQRPNVTREVDDGRNHLLVSGHKYDVIVSDLVEPRHTGASVLYSREYFESARRALNPGGIMVQWLGSPSTDAYRWTLNTFGNTFPYTTFWMNGDVGIGSNEPQPPIDVSRIERFLADPALRPALKDDQLGSVESILALKAVQARPFVKGPVLTDDRPVLEYFATLPFVTRLAFGER
jgi:SAM-dependent methyltransferase